MHSELITRERKGDFSQTLHPKVTPQAVEPTAGPKELYMVKQQLLLSSYVLGQKESVSLSSFPSESRDPAWNRSCHCNEVLDLPLY